VSGWDTTWNAVEAIGTSGALLVAATALLGQVKDKRREQASKVSAVFGGATGEGNGKHTVRVRVTNRSDEPIYEVSCFVRGHQGHMPYGETRPFTLPGQGDGQYEIPEVQEDGLLYWREVGVHFRDAAGRHWTRFPDGHLRDRTRAVALLRWAEKRDRHSRLGGWQRNAAYRLAARLGRKWCT
jgi:hypothetical protein